MKSLFKWIVVGIFGLLLITFPRGYPPKPLESQVTSPIPVFTWTRWSHQIEDVLHRLVTLSFGTGLNLRPILPLEISQFGSTLSLVGWGMLFILLLGATKGIYDGMSQKSKVGSFFSSGIQWLLESIPEFFVIISLEFIFFYLARNNVVNLYIVGGRHLVMGTIVPALILAFTPMMYMSRMVRAKVQEQLGQQYLVTAIAKGLTSRRVLLKHLVPNVFPTVFYTIVPSMALLFSNLVIVEFLTARSGIVSGILDAIGTTNYTPVWEGPTPPTHFTYSPFDYNRLFAYALGIMLIFVIFIGLIRLVLRLVGFRGQSNAYAQSPHATTNTSRFPWQLVVGCGIVILLLLLGVLSNHLGLPSPTVMDSLHMNNDQMSTPPFAPSFQHLLGTDSAGHDVLSETLHALIPTFLNVLELVTAVIIVALLIAVCASIWNVRVFRGIIEVWNSLTTVIPPNVLALFILVTPTVQYFDVHITDDFIRWGIGHSLVYLAVIGFVEAGRTAYQLQVALDDLEHKTYIEASIVSGASPFARLQHHHWRTLKFAVLEQMVVLISRVLLVIATLGFLSVPMQGYWYLTSATGLHPDWLYQISQNDWSGILAASVGEFLQQGTVWAVFAPVLFITVTVFSMNLIQVGLQRGSQRMRKVSSFVQMVDSGDGVVT